MNRLLTNDEQCDFLDVLNDKFPNMGVRLQNALINLVELVAQAQLDKAESLIREDEHTKSVKARDKEWVEWLEHALFEVLSEKSIKELIQSGNWFKCREWVNIGIKQKIEQALKRGIGEK